MTKLILVFISFSFLIYSIIKFDKLFVHSALGNLISENYLFINNYISILACTLYKVSTCYESREVLRKFYNIKHKIATKRIFSRSFTCVLHHRSAYNLSLYCKHNINCFTFSLSGYQKLVMLNLAYQLAFFLTF